MQRSRDTSYYKMAEIQNPKRKKKEEGERERRERNERRKSTDLEEAAEVRTTRRENDLVRGEAATVACQGHVHEILLVPEMTK